MLKKKKQVEIEQYDREKYRAVLRCSICNGEQVVGFKNIHTGEFHEIMLVRNASELEEFQEKYDVAVVTKEY